MKYLVHVLFLFFLYTCLWGQSTQMNIHLKTDSTKSFTIKSIRKITFSNLITAVDKRQALENIVKTFALFQNYPNPFNPTTTIQYELPRDGAVDISIFNIKGQKVKQFNFDSQPAGIHSIVWDGKNNAEQRVATGLYIYRAKFENTIIAKRMIVIK